MGAARTNPHTGDLDVLAIQHRLLAAEIDPAKFLGGFPMRLDPTSLCRSSLPKFQATRDCWGWVLKT
jgi:hypothetical protein